MTGITRCWRCAVMAAIALGVAALAATGTGHAGNDAWIDRDGPAWADLEAVDGAFGGQETLVVVLLADDVLAPAQLAWLERRVAAAAAITVVSAPAVASAWSLLDARDAWWEDGSLATGRLGDDLRGQLEDLGAINDALRAHLVGHPLYADLLINRDATATAIMVELRDGGAEAVADTLRDQLAADPPPSGSVHLAGLPLQKQALSRVAGDDQRLIAMAMGLALLFLVGAMVLHPLLVVAPLATVATALPAVHAALVLAGQAPDALLNLLTPMTMAVGVVAALHIQHATIGERGLRRGLHRVWLPLTLAAVTTLLGLAGLAWGPVHAVRRFGLWAALAVVLANLSALGWCWATGPMIGEHCRERYRRGPLGEAGSTLLSNLARAAARFRWGTVALVLLASGVAGYGLTRVTVDADFLGALPADEPVRIAHQRLDAELTGVLPTDVVVAVDHQPTAADLAGLEAVAAAWRAHDPSLRHVLSIADAVAYVRSQAPAEEDPPSVADVLLDLRVGAPEVYGRLVGDDGAGGSLLRIAGRQADGRLSHATMAFPAITSATAAAFPDAASLWIASPHRLLAETSDRVVPSLLAGLATVLPALLVLIALSLRGLRPGLVAAAACSMPLVAVYALLPVFGWPLDVAVAMIACVAAGVVVDFAVHLLAAIRRRGEVAAGTAEVGPVLVGSGAILIVTFGLCLVGRFAHTGRFGFLMACAVALALVANLLLVPALMPRSPATSGEHP